jgi:hypothetical protein
MPKVSVINPTYNRANYINQAIQSAKNPPTCIIRKFILFLATSVCKNVDSTIGIACGSQDTTSFLENSATISSIY